MAAWSKLPPEIETASCIPLAHPWTNSCLTACCYTYVDSFLGSTIFFFLLYLGQYASTVLKKKRKMSFKDFLRKQLQSTFFGATVSAVTFSISCLLRNVLKRYYYYSVILIPATIGGFGCFLENRKGLALYVNAFANCALEFCIRRLEHSKILKWNPNVQTFIFMVTSSFLSFLFNWTNYDLNYFWFFIPPKGSKNNENKVCFHKEDCMRHIFKLFLMYSTTGLALQSLNLFFRNFKNPKLVLTSLTKAKTYKLTAFLGGYAVIYQAIRCFLYQKEKKNSVKHDAIAGFLAGTAFRFQPTPAILNSGIITIIQILGEAALRRKMLPNIPYSELIFALLCGLMFHARVLYEEQCPQLMIYIMSTVTHGMSDKCTQNYKNMLKSLNSA